VTESNDSATRVLAVRTPRDVLARLLDTPDLPAVVQSLEPAVLQQLVRHCGLEDCGEIVALATTDQLTRLFDADLWTSSKGAGEERFDEDRFVLWLEVLSEVGTAVAARKIAEMDFDFVSAAVSRYVLVLDPDATMEAQGTVEEIEDMADALGEGTRAALLEQFLDDRLSYDLGGYRLIARKVEAWDAVVSLLLELEHGHHDSFERLMRRCARVATEHIVDNGGLYDVLTADEQLLADAAANREQRREQEGYVAPAEAAAFLLEARKPPSNKKQPGRDPLTAAYFRELARHEPSGRGAVGTPPPAADTQRQVDAFLATLQESGVLEPARPRLLLGPAEAGDDRLGRIRAHLLDAQQRDADARARSTEELAYLANVLIAGCSLDGRRFRAVEAADAVLAACNLGLQKKNADASDLVGVFRAGWNILYEEVSLFVAEQFITVLDALPFSDLELRADARRLARALRKQVDLGSPWQARESLDVVLRIDPQAWAMLRGLLDECPVLTKPTKGRALRMSSEFDFISETRQLARVREFALSLPEALVGA
jgi:hypothetical protein